MKKMQAGHLKEPGGIKHLTAFLAAHGDELPPSLIEEVLKSARKPKSGKLKEGRTELGKKQRLVNGGCA